MATPQPQVLITLGAGGRLQAELPGLNGSRRKVPLTGNDKSQEAIAIALEVLRDIAAIQPDETALITATKAQSLLSELQSKVNAANDAANLISHILKQDNILS